MRGQPLVKISENTARILKKRIGARWHGGGIALQEDAYEKIAPELLRIANKHGLTIVRITQPSMPVNKLLTT